MEKTNFTSLRWLLLGLVALFSINFASAQSVGCNDNVQISTDASAVGYYQMVRITGQSSLQLRVVDGDDVPSSACEAPFSPGSSYVKARGFDPTDDCQVVVTPAMILEGETPAQEASAVLMLLNQAGQPILTGAAGAPLTIDAEAYNLWGRTVKFKVVTDDGTCWGSAIFEDKNPPAWYESCFDAVTVPCDFDLDRVPSPIVAEDCMVDRIELIDQTHPDACAWEGDEGQQTKTLVRTWIAIDVKGNRSTTCTQEITITRETPEAPEDLSFEWTVFAGKSRAEILELMEPSSLAGVFGRDYLPTNTKETPLTGSAGKGLDEWHATDMEQVNIRANAFPKGLNEHGNCQYSYNKTDVILEACGETFKIHRTWKVLDWCTGDAIDLLDEAGDPKNSQLIVLFDGVNPTATYENKKVSANVPGQHPQYCSFSGRLPAPALKDNCDPNPTGSILIYSDAARTILVWEAKASNNYFVPSGILGVGTYYLTIVAKDNCLNEGRYDDYTLTVIDNIAPTAVCIEETTVSLTFDQTSGTPGPSTGGIGYLYASSIDNGSTDNCCIDFYEIRRMEDAGDCRDGNTTFTNATPHPYGPGSAVKRVVSNNDAEYDKDDVEDKGDYVTFCCDDLGKINQVVFRVWDCYGNYNECMVNVQVECKVPAIIHEVPEDAKITCNKYWDELESKLALAGTDGAAASKVLEEAGFGSDDDVWFEALCGDLAVTVTTTVDQCGEGRIVRTWTAGEAGKSASRRQVIDIVHYSDWVVEFPVDVTIECDETTAGLTLKDNPDALAGLTIPDSHKDFKYCIEPDGIYYSVFGGYVWDNIANCDSDIADEAEPVVRPNVYFDDCELVGVSFKDQQFDVVQDACFKIARTWTVINWCVVGEKIDEEVKEDSECEIFLAHRLDGSINFGNLATKRARVQALAGFLDLDGDCDLDNRTFRDSWVADYADVAWPLGNTNLAAHQPYRPGFGLDPVVDGCEVDDKLDATDVACERYHYPNNYSDALVNGGGYGYQGRGYGDTDEDLNPWDGYIEYTQVIKVNDETAPTMDIPTQEKVNVDTDDCSKDFTLNIPDAIDCSPSIDYYRVTFGQENGVTVTLKSRGADLADPRDDVYTVDLSGDDDKRAILEFVVEFADNCGNSGSAEGKIEVADCKKPTPYARDLYTVVMNTPAPSVEVWASDFNIGSFDNCALADDPFRAIKESDAAGLSMEEGYAAATKGVVFDCGDLGQTAVRFYVTDMAGNFDFVIVPVFIQDNMLQCPGGGDPQVAGLIADENNRNVEDVEVTINGGTPEMTSAAGNFSFTAEMGSDVSIVPSKDNDPRNGVKTSDIVLLRRHILGTSKLNSAYKVIAADVNNSGNVSTLDIVDLRRVILFINDNFTNNTSWRFVDKGYSFANPANPLAENFPEVININDVSSDVLAANFVAVKVGDLNGDAVTSSLLGSTDDRTAGEFAIEAEDMTMVAGEEYVVDFTAADLANGFQFTMNFTDAVNFVDVVPGIAKEENFGFALLNEGAITASWDGEAAEGVLFSLVFKANENVNLSEAIAINSRFTSAEAYTDNGTATVALTFNGDVASAGFELFQNTPNPFNGVTTIGFNLPEAGAATLTVQDVSGKVLRTVNVDGVQGYNNVTLNADQLPAVGVLYYTLETANDTATKRMVLVK